jgi:PhnB protein
MKTIQPYIFFNGNCREAMTFYAKALGAEINFHKAGDTPGTPPAHGERIMHAHLGLRDIVIMASDWMSSEPFPEGRSFSLSIDCDSPEEQDRLFAAIGEGGAVTMPLQDTFWGARFGMVQDKFGIRWMFSHHIPQPAS